jgi:serine/threonine protein kinase/Tfp pilus assembly protein PilF
MTEMSPAEAIFFAALERSPGERAAFLDAACAGDAELRGRLEKMLVAQSHLGGFLDQPQAQAAPDLPRTGPPEPPPEAAGAVLAGKYKLLQRIGEGGVGSVWMADQLAPVKRRVAVKLIHSDRGSSQTILARFEAERQAIALMDHPHIARLLDAGTTGAAEAPTVGAGRPYFVMELIKGVPLHDYCDQHKLSIAERLHLFMQICAAVQHAHTKGIIHRDLKPTNILVEAHDDKPVPKVIDFGLAKAVSEQLLTERTLFTGFGTVAGTPLYMAPEQAKFNAIDVDTRTDVYALGVILYELLTGTTPIEREQLKTAAFDEVLRVIRESEPPTPSKRLSSTASRPSVAANRQMEPLKLGRLLRGDLDWIVMKALAKERDRRYETANSFARDIERFLNHEPVLAGPPSASYRLRKFVRRNRAQVLAGCLLLLALLLGLSGTTFGLIRAEHRRVEAEQARADEAEQRTRAEKARDRTWQALDDMTSSVTGDSLTTQKALSDEQKKFLREVLTYYQEFAGEKADDEPSRARTAAAAYRVGLIEYRLGRKAEAAAAFRLARDGYAKLAADFPAVPDYRQHLALSHNNLGNLFTGLGKRPKAQEQYRQALAIQAKLAADFPAVPRYQIDLGGSYCHLGNLVSASGRPRASLVWYEKAIRTLTATYEQDRRLVAAKQFLRNSHLGRAITYERLRKYARAVKDWDKAVELSPKEEQPRYRAKRATLRLKAGQVAEAVAEVAELMKLPGHPQDAPAYHNLGVALYGKGQVDEAIACYQKVIHLEPKLAPAHYGLGHALAHKGQVDRAIAAYRQAIQIDPQFAEAHWNLGHALARQGQFAESLAALRRGHQLGSKRSDWPSPSAQWAREAERLAALEARLSAFLKGELRPEDTTERLGLVGVCQAKKLHHAATRLYADAFAADPKLADELKAGHRYKAACCAALAAAGQGADAAKLDAKGKARLRKQALDWLRADLAVRTRQLESGKPADRAAVQRALKHWQQDGDLAGLRDAAALAKLPAEERPACAKLWADVAALRKQAEGKTK